MPLTAKEIDELEFGTALRGYDPDEVDDLLDRVAAQIHRTEREVGDLRTRLHEAELRAQDAREHADRLRRELSAAHEDAAQELADTKEQAERELHAAVELAHQDAQRRVTEAESDLARRVEEARLDFEERLRGAEQDAEARVAEAWASVDVERAELARERDRVHEEFASLRRVAASVHAALRSHVSDQAGRLDEVAAHLAAIEGSVGDAFGDESGDDDASGRTVAPAEDVETEILEVGGLQVRIHPEAARNRG